MIKTLPFIIIPVILVIGLGYWRYASTKQALTAPANQQNEAPAKSDLAPAEVPYALPAIPDQDKSFDNTTVVSTGNSSSVDSRISSLESTVSQLQARISALEKVPTPPTTTTTTTTAKYPLYIPLGSGGGPWGDQAWNTLGEYQISLDPASYQGYTSMQLEANFRLAEAAGTGSVRLYNVTDQGSVSPQLDTISTSFSNQTSGTFKLASGQKTYTLQIKTSQGKSLFLQSARIKVNF